MSEEGGAESDGHLPRGVSENAPDWAKHDLPPIAFAVVAIPIVAIGLFWGFVASELGLGGIVLTVILLAGTLALYAKVLPRIARR